MTIENEEIYDDEVVEREIDLSKTYSLPREICIVEYKMFIWPYIQKGYYGLYCKMMKN